MSVTTLDAGPETQTKNPNLDSVNRLTFRQKIARARKQCGKFQIDEKNFCKDDAENWALNNCLV